MKQKRGQSSSNFDRLSGRFSGRFFVPPSKQGQITVFIIVGILILFIFSGALYLTKRVTKEELTVEGEPVIAAVPQEFQPLQAFTEECLTQTARRGLLVLGQQGGYIYPELIGEFSSTDPSDADGIDLEPMKVPYWHYNVVSNQEGSTSYASLQPSLRFQEDPELSIEAQLSRFAEKNLNECLGNYVSFSERGFIVEAPALAESSNEVKEVIVNVAEESVNFWLKMNVNAKLDGAEVSMNQFYVSVPVRLKHYYGIAAEITGAERKHNFLELQALDLITAYASVDANKLPPMEQITFDLISTVTWAETDVRERMRGLLTSNIPLLRHLQSTNFYRYQYPPEKEAAVSLQELYQKHYDNMILPLNTGKNIEISFDYFGWEPFLEMNDKGGKIEPSSFHAPSISPLPPIPFTLNHFFSVYDVSYPVLVTIRDAAALNGRGYTFAFALESNIRNNAIPPDGHQALPPIALEQESMVCDPSKRNTELIKALVVDSGTFEPLEAVQIGFSIPEQDDCVMGQTDDSGEFESGYPAVYGGVASFFKDDYLVNFYPIDTYRYKEQPGVIGYAIEGTSELVMPLHKVKSTDVSFRKKSLEKCIGEDDTTRCFTQGLFAAGLAPVYSYAPEALDTTHNWIFPNTVRTLSDDERGTIIMKRVGDSTPGIFGGEFSASADAVGSGTTQMELVPGIYEVNAFITREKDLIIPEEERCVGLSCFTFEEQVMGKLLVGQLHWNESKTYLTITPEQLYNANEIVFTVLAFNLEGVPQEEHLRIMEDLQVMGELGRLSQTLRSKLEPAYK